MTTLSFSSGDLIADRRADYAEMLFTAGDVAAAAELMADALALAPSWAAGHYRRGEMLEAEGRMTDAADCWREALRLAPQDPFGAALKLALVGAAADHAPVGNGFVETLFDQYAGEFDSALVERLGYRVPELLADAIARTGRERFAHCIDLGCGTGLMGERLRIRTSFLEGLDISGEMLRKAAAKGVYDRLDKRDIQLADSLPEGADIVTAADVFMYLGALEHVMALAAAALPPAALFAFSVERNDGGEKLVLRPSRRHAHSEAYVREALSAAGFAVSSCERATIRHDRGEPVEGLVVVAERQASAIAAAGPLAQDGAASAKTAMRAEH